MAALRCLYDLRYAPVTFDFGTFLAVADCVRCSRMINGRI